VPLWLALSRDTRVDPMDEDSLAAKLVKHGASPDAINNITGDWSLLLMLSSCWYRMCLTNLYPVGKNCRPVTQPNQSYSETKFECVTSAGRGFFGYTKYRTQRFLFIVTF